MNNNQWQTGTVLLLLATFIAFTTAPAQAKTKPLQYTFPSSIGTATIGKTFTYNFCRPKPGAGKFCGKVLAKSPATTNPTGGTPPYTFRINGVGLPFGLALNLNGNITGKPKTNTPTGKRYFQVCVTDRVGKKKCQRVNITVKKQAITTNTNTSASTVSSLTCTYVGTGDTTWDGTTTYTYRVDAAGTASGPANTEIELSLYQNTFALGRDYYPTVSASAWTADETYPYYYYRHSGQPASTNWAFYSGITISYNPSDAQHAWPTPTEHKLQLNMKNYISPSTRTDASGSQTLGITCPTPS